MSSLLEFLRARLDEDESAAAAVRPDQDYSDSEHQGRWSPGRVLREVEAKRRIIAECPSGGVLADELVGMFGDLILALLALPYADHPDYDEAWRP